MSFAYLALYTGDYLRDTRHLTPLKHGVYILLLMHCWDSRGPVPLDEQECAGIANCRSADEIDALRYVLGKYFVRMDDGWYNARIQREIQRAEAISSKRSVAAMARHGTAAPVKVLPGQRKSAAKLSAARAIATHTDEEWDALVEYHDGRCAKCGTDQVMMCKDHVISLHKGGHDGIENLQPLCHTCNIAKGGGGTEDYRKTGWQMHLQSKCMQMHARGATPTPTPISTTTTIPTPVASGEKVKSTRRASRLSIDQLPPEWAAWTRQHRPDLNPESVFEHFRDYWIAIPGAKGCKLDWDATWRNWCRNQGGSPTGRKTLSEKNNDAVQQWLQGEKDVTHG